MPFINLAINYYPINLKNNLHFLWLKKLRADHFVKLHIIIC